MTLPIELDVDKVQVDLHVKVLVHTSNGSAVRAKTHTQTALILIPRPLTRKVKINIIVQTGYALEFPQMDGLMGEHYHCYALSPCDIVGN